MPDGIEPLDEESLQSLLDANARASELTGDDVKDIQEFADKYLSSAKEAIEECLTSEKDSVKLSAAKFVFQLKYGKELTIGETTNIEKLLQELSKND